jgi:hypothetical protein
LDENQSGTLVVTHEEESDSDTGSNWVEPILQYGDHAMGPRIDIWADENNMASLTTDRGRKLFSGDRDGPPLRHLKQMSSAQDVSIPSAQTVD